MPTAKPRVQVTLNESSYATLSRIARAQGISRSAVLSELFEAAQPAMEKVADLLEAAKLAPKDTLQRFRNALAVGEQSTLHAHHAQLGQMDLLLHGLRGALPGTRSAAADTRAAGVAPPSVALVTPVPVTRGSGTPSPPRARGGKRGRKRAARAHK